MEKRSKCKRSNDGDKLPIQGDDRLEEPPAQK